MENSANQHYFEGLKEDALKGTAIEALFDVVLSGEELPEAAQGYFARHPDVLQEQLDAFVARRPQHAEAFTVLRLRNQYPLDASECA